MEGGAWYSLWPFGSGLGGAPTVGPQSRSRLDGQAALAP